MPVAMLEQYARVGTLGDGARLAESFEKMPDFRDAAFEAGIFSALVVREVLGRVPARV